MKTTSNTSFKFEAWKSDSKCNPIENTERNFTGPNREFVLKFLAFEEGVELKPGSIHVECQDGSRWNVHRI